MCSEDALLIKFIKDNPLVKRNINFYKPLFLFIYFLSSWILASYIICQNMFELLYSSICESLLQPATLLKVTLLDGCFSRFLNCTKYQIAQSITYVKKWAFCEKNISCKSSVPYHFLVLPFLTIYVIKSCEDILTLYFATS